MPRKERALCPGFTTGTFGVRLLNSFIFTALSACSLRFHKTSLMAGVTVEGLGKRQVLHCVTGFS